MRQADPGRPGKLPGAALSAASADRRFCEADRVPLRKRLTGIDRLRQRLASLENFRLRRYLQQTALHVRFLGARLPSRPTDCLYHGGNEERMKLELKSLSLRYRMDFSRPAVEVGMLTGRLLEELVTRLAAKFTLSSSDLRTLSGPTLADYGIKVSLFNNFGSLDLTPDRLECAFKGLISPADIRVVSETTEIAIKTVGDVLPRVMASREMASGDLVYRVVDGPGERDEYFSRVKFPGQGLMHKDHSFKVRVNRIQEDMEPALFEIAPLWSDPSSVYVHFEVLLFEDTVADFVERADKLSKFVEKAMISFDLQVIDSHDLPRESSTK